MRAHIKFLFIILFAGLIIYVGSYAAFRSRHVKVWEKDNHSYVIFPEDKIYLYYFYRPLTYVDSVVTKMRFHVGPHR